MRNDIPARFAVVNPVTGPSTLVRGARLVTILLVALVLGLAFAHVLERPAKMDYDGRLYSTLQRTLYREWGPPNVGGFLEPAAIAATLVLAILVRRERRVFWLTVGAGVVMLLAFPVVFFWIVAPVNAVFLSGAPGTVPANWTELRSQWELGHTVRFVLQLIALALLVASVEVGERRSQRRSIESWKSP